MTQFSPLNTARWANMHRIQHEDRRIVNAHRYDAQRRADARRNGYHGPLTRAELSARSH